MTPQTGVLDTAAILAYAHGHHVVGAHLAHAAAAGEQLVIPAACLVEAYDHTHPGPEHDLIGLLLTQPAITTVPLDLDAALFVGAVLTRAKRLGAAHAAYTAITRAAVIFTGHPAEIAAAIGAPWPIIEI